MAHSTKTITTLCRRIINAMRVQSSTSRIYQYSYLASMGICLLMLFSVQAYAQKGCGPCMPDPNNPGSGTQACLNPSGELTIRSCRISEPVDPPQNTCFNPAPNAVTLYIDKNYKGRCKVLSPGIYANSSAMDFPDNKASSIRLGSGSSAYICHNESLEGNCDIIVRNDSDLSNTRVGNDRLSSIGVGEEGYRPCIVAADPPEVNSDFVIIGRGSRGPNCLRSANVQLLVRNDLFLRSDVTLATESNSGTGVELEAAGLCSDLDSAGSRGIYTEIRVNRKNVGQSRRVWPSRCAFTPLSR